MVRTRGASNQGSSRNTSAGIELAACYPTANGSSLGSDLIVTAVQILLVEDEGLIRMMTAEALQDEGFEVVEAFNGDEAVKLLDGPEHFDVLLTDVRMPGSLDGVEVALHARQRYPAIPIVVTSGYAADLVARLSVLDPSAVLIGKPYGIAKMVEALKRLTKHL